MYSVQYEASKLCSGRNMKRVTTAEFIRRATDKHGGRYVYPTGTEWKAKATVPIVCPVHGEFRQIVWNHINGKGCPKCAGQGVDWVERFKSVHGDTYDYSRVQFVHGQAPVEIICPEHGVFRQTPEVHFRGSGCPKCAGRGVDWVERFKSVHGDMYDYSRAVYTGYKSKIRILCPEHGEFLQTPDNHYRNAQGCPQCRNAQNKDRFLTPAARFIEQAVAVHGAKYSYAKVQYSGKDRKVTIVCPEHGAFEQTPASHVRGGCGCPKCAGRGADKVAQFALVHGDRYDYSGVRYTTPHAKVQIRCSTHGVFMQSPTNHLAGQGCPRCSHHISKGEDAVAKFLSVFTPVERHVHPFPDRRELDVFIPVKNIAIEYCGDYHHSHGDAEQEARGSMKHAKKYEDCQKLGIRLITMWESEWVNRQYAIKRLLRNAVGKSRGKLMARKCDLRLVPHPEAVAFYDRYHPQGGSGQGEHYGLYWNDKLVACMRFTEGANDRGTNKRRQWTLTRYATRITVAGGASRLFKAFVKSRSPKEVKSFSDNRFFDGGMYVQLGFKLVETSKPDYAVFHQKLGTLPKSAWQRRNLPKIAAKLGVELDFDPDTDPRTENDITYLLGGRHLHDCGKKKWVWSA